MGEEKRRSKRLDMHIAMKVSTIEDVKYIIPVKDSFEVEIVNVSKDGIAFRSKEILLLNSVYKAEVVLWTKESFDAVIEIVRMENYGNEDTLYGCRFIGITGAEQFKIDVYDIINNR